MKQCPFCHELIEEKESLCPFCGTIQEESVDKDSNSIQTSLFDDENTTTQQTTTENRSEQEYRIKNNQAIYANFWKKIIRFFSFFVGKLIHPTNNFSRKRQNSRLFGYVIIIVSTLLSAYITTHGIRAILSQYQLLADISILPSLTVTPNYILLFIKLLLFYTVFYFGFPAIAFGVKHIFLKRQHVFYYWLTQYEAMNALAIILLMITAFMTFVSPIALLVVILFFFTLHLFTFIVTFVISIAQEQNDTRLDTPYVALIGLSIQLIIVLSFLFILF